MRAAFRLVVALSGVSVSAIAQADQDPLQPYFLTEKDVPGLQALGEGRHASGEDLTLIYDGGYQRYRDAGVMGASQRFYRLLDGTVEITLNEMSGPPAADGLLSAVCRDIKAMPTEVRRVRKARMCQVSRDGSAYGYVASGNLLAMVSLDRGDGKSVIRLLESVARRWATLSSIPYGRHPGATRRKLAADSRMENSPQMGAR